MLADNFHNDLDLITISDVSLSILMSNLELFYKIANSKKAK